MSHETVIVQDILKEAKKHGKLKSIEVEVGEVAHIPADELEPTLKELAPCKVKLKETEAVVQCMCGYTGRPKILEKGHDLTYFECPECKKVPKVLKGDKITLVAVEVE